MTTIPIALPSAANMRTHWRERQRRIKGQRAAVMLKLPVSALARERNWLELNGRIIVTLTRISPRKLDDDNLAFAFKGIRDQVAQQLGIDDGDSCVGWHYQQERPDDSGERASTKQAIRITLALVDNRPQPAVPFA